jgi:hypothetical protein
MIAADKQLTKYASHHITHITSHHCSMKSLEVAEGEVEVLTDLKDFLDSITFR